MAIDRNKINCEYPCNVFVEAIYRSRSDEERDLLLSFLTRYFDFLIARGDQCQLSFDRRETRSACLCMSFCLRDPLCQDAAWQWFAEVLEEASAEERQKLALETGVLSDFFEGPIDWSNDNEMFLVEKLFQLAQQPNREWILVYTYEGFSSRKFQNDITEYNSWCRRQGREDVMLSSEFVQHLLETIEFYEDDDDKCSENGELPEVS